MQSWMVMLRLHQHHLLLQRSKGPSLCLCYLHVFQCWDHLKMQVWRQWGQWAVVENTQQSLKQDHRWRYRVALYSALFRRICLELLRWGRLKVCFSSSVFFMVCVKDCFWSAMPKLWWHKQLKFMLCPCCQVLTDVLAKMSIMFKLQAFVSAISNSKHSRL